MNKELQEYINQESSSIEEPYIRQAYEAGATLIADKLMGEMEKRDVIIKKLWEFQFYATCPKTNDEDIMNQLYDNTWQQFKTENNL